MTGRPLQGPRLAARLNYVSTSIQKMSLDPSLKNRKIVGREGSREKSCDPKIKGVGPWRVKLKEEGKTT